MDRNNLLIEINRILGNEELAEDIEIQTPTPEGVARSFQVSGNTVIDDAVLESLAQLEWDDLLQVAGFSLLPEEEIVALSRALSEGTTSFRLAWRSVKKRHSLPEDLSRGAFLLANKISPDDAVVRRVVNWAKLMIGEADSTVKEKLAKKMPALAKSMYVPAGDSAKAAKEREETEKYMEPHLPGSDKPTDKTQVMTTRIFQDPDAREAERDGLLKDVEATMKKLADIAHKFGKQPDEIFPMLWRDMARERTRYS